MHPIFAEFIGTAILILLGNGVVANVALHPNKGYKAGFHMVTVGWGLAVYAGVLIAGPHSGAHINPAVSISLAIAGEFDWAWIPGYIAAQLAGAAMGSLLVWLAYMGQYRNSVEEESKLATFCTIPEFKNKSLNFLTEAIGTFVLIIAVLSIAGPVITLDQSESATIGLGSLGALPVALIVIGIGMSLGGPTGYAINPARDLMPRLMHSILPIGKKGDSQWNYAWVPVLGPITGGMIAVVIKMVADLT
ncbi:MAG TPA: MIP/aquaporin family protein [Saprospiraceae bacterium]|nr:MIP/aquaporin family protein [Saprospiraceae bacterium]